VAGHPQLLIFTSSAALLRTPYFALVWEGHLLQGNTLAVVPEDISGRPRGQWATSGTYYLYVFQRPFRATMKSRNLGVHITSSAK